MGAPAPAPWLPPWDERVIEGLANVSQPAPGIAHWFAAGPPGPSLRCSAPAWNNVPRAADVPLSGTNPGRARAALRCGRNVARAGTPERRM